MRSEFEQGFDPAVEIVDQGNEVYPRITLDPGWCHGIRISD